MILNRNHLNMRIKLLALAGMILLLTYCQPSGSSGGESTDVVGLDKEEDLRIVSLSGFLTELLFELGYGDKIVGIDVTSTYPPEANQIEKLGHISQLNAEGILGLNPDVIFMEEDQIKQSDIFSQLENSTIEIVSVKTKYTLMNAVHVAEKIKEFIPIDEKEINELRKELISDSTALSEYLINEQNKPSILFIYARGGGNLMVAGENTSAQAIIELAGGENAITSFENFRALSPEALLEASPEVILMFDSGLASLNGKEGLSKVPGISQTPAYQNDRVVTMDGHYLTGFGPRVGKAALELAKKINTKEL